MPAFVVACLFAGVLIPLLVAYLRIRVRVAKLEGAVLTDPLTGLLNRRGFDERIEIELERARRDGTPLALVMSDLDWFKEVNDRLGHLGGDMALERVAGVISRTARRSDATARLGGEEFAFVLPNTRRVQGLAMAERVRAGIERSFDGTAVGVTLSLGVAQFPDDGRTAEELLNAADRAMYRAKGQGKNQTVLYDPGWQNPPPRDAPHPATRLTMQSSGVHATRQPNARREPDDDLVRTGAR
jgi:diguanylate cyclase (GGDEF)-like protein